jgi:hypothetical protein
VMTDNRKEDLIKMIEESFRDTVYPGDDNLFSDVYDPDIPAFSEILLGKHWKETLSILEPLETPSLLFYETIFYSMTPESLHYYTPAFLIIALDEKSDVFGDTFLKRLNPMDPSLDEEHVEYHASRFSQLMQLFSLRQKQAVATTLQYIYSNYDDVVKEVIESDFPYRNIYSYWSQWLPS